MSGKHSRMEFPKTNFNSFLYFLGCGKLVTFLLFIFKTLKKIIYIIPGFGENCNLIRYKNLAIALQNKGYTVKLVNPEWYRPLSEQVFKPEKDSVIFGFSLGSVIAYLIASKYKCKKIIFGSLSPIHLYTYKLAVEMYEEHMSRKKAEENAKDIMNIKISLETLKTPYILIKGELENSEMKGDVLVPKTGHFVNKNYIRAIESIL